MVRNNIFPGHECVPCERQFIIKILILNCGSFLRLDDSGYTIVWLFLLSIFLNHREFSSAEITFCGKNCSVAQWCIVLAGCVCRATDHPHEGNRRVLLCVMEAGVQCVWTTQRSSGSGHRKRGQRNNHITLWFAHNHWSCSRVISALTDSQRSRVCACCGRHRRQAFLWTFVRRGNSWMQRACHDTAASTFLQRSTVTNRSINRKCYRVHLSAAIIY